MVYITGYGLLSSLPEEDNALWQALNHSHDSIQTVVNAQKFAPFFYHPLTDYPIETQIPNHSDKRAMDVNMQAAVYSAGKALSMAGLKHDETRLMDTDIVICFSGGGRNEAADQKVLQMGLSNEALMKNIRPTLFLGQLPNLLAANISIVHNVTGSSLTLMGEEIAGAQAVQIAYQRIQSGKAKRVLVGSVSINETPENMLHFAAQNLLLSHSFLPVWDRIHDGICLGSASGFLLLESHESVMERDAKPLGKISQLRLESSVSLDNPGELVLLSGLSGYPGHVQQQQLLWADWQKQHLLWIRALGTLTGLVWSATFPSYLIFALQCLQRQQLFAPIPSELNIEKSYDEKLNKIWVHCQGHLFGHALACLERV